MAVGRSNLYAVVGRNRYDIWPVCWRPSAIEAGSYVDALNRDAEVFAAWKLKMQLNNSEEHYEDLIEKYIESQMLDPQFVEGCEYIVWNLPDDSRQVVV